MAANPALSVPHIQLVVAYARNRCIGRDNALPWRLPSDLAHFKKSTLGHPVIMGRATWESIGRPLPGRANHVVSRNPRFRAEGASVWPGIEEALQACAREAIVSIIGGAQIYAASLPLAHEVIATEIHHDVEGDAFFPPLNPAQWQEVERLPQPAENGWEFDFVRYQRCAVQP